MELPDPAIEIRIPLTIYKELSFRSMTQMTVVDVEVCVAGAGVSGLKCAHALVNDKSNKFSPSDIVVLEAQQRIGGRITQTPACPKHRYS